MADSRDEMAAEPGSFRDPRGRIYSIGERIFRTVTAEAIDDVRWLTDSGYLANLVDQGLLIPTHPVDRDAVSVPGQAAALVEHERIPFVSYPYEWPFSALKAAALCHLDLHLKLLACDGTLTDASAYNVQFRGSRPVFIDLLSVRRYVNGEYWLGHRQFVEQFLTPLLLQRLFGIPYNSWYRGALEGIALQDFARLLSFRQWLSWRLALHILLPARLQSNARHAAGRAQGLAARVRLPKARLIGLLTGLTKWIEQLEPGRGAPTPWIRYADQHSYGGAEVAQKRAFVADFMARVRPRLVLDLGCNTGDYSALALQSGAEMVIGAEADPQTADVAFRRAVAQGLNFLPLVVDAANPSPSHGWRARERTDFVSRAKFDALIALAFVHHLAIGRNVPLDQLLIWHVDLAPVGVIEFVPKSDPTVQTMLALREDVFLDYSDASFASILGRLAHIERREVISSSGRTLYWYARMRGSC